MKDKRFRSSKAWRKFFLKKRMELISWMLTQPDPWEMWEEKNPVKCTCPPDIYNNLTIYCVCNAPRPNLLEWLEKK